MTDYVVGDIQGCLDSLLGLLKKIRFNSTNDRLIAAGDIINRGPKSLETLRYCKSLGSAFKMVLGNHDLHLLAIAHGVRGPTAKDTLQKIMIASDLSDLLEWLQQQPLLLTIGEYTIVHAGIPPQWSISLAQNLASEMESVLISEHAGRFFDNMYGNFPDIWTSDINGLDRLRLITNYFTRMRFCTEKGQLDLEKKDSIKTSLPYKAWFSWSSRKAANEKIVFGHWAALEGRNCGPNLFALDTGCVWGGPLRVMNLTTEEYTDHVI